MCPNLHSSPQKFAKEGSTINKRGFRTLLSLTLASMAVLALAGSASAAVTPRTQSSSNQVNVLFEPTLTGTQTYKVYRHSRVPSNIATLDRSFDLVATMNYDGTNNPTCPGLAAGDSCSKTQPDANSMTYLVFTDGGDVNNYEEYYYLVAEGTQTYKDDPTNFVIVSAFPPNQTRHGSYTEYTGACTGCHGLHSAQTSQKLLKGATVADLCSTCHDGSVSKYDEVRGRVMMGANGSAYAPAPAGPFGKQLSNTVDDPNVPPHSTLSGGATDWASSVHNIYRGNGPASAIVYQAPGSGFRPAGQTTGAGEPTQNLGSGTDFSPVGWKNQLSCISCHEPHNKFLNFRLLRNDANDGLVGDGAQPTGGIAIRGLSETGVDTAGGARWPQAYTDHGSVVAGSVYVSQTKFLANTARFCSQCHRAFYNNSVRVADERIIRRMLGKTQTEQTLTTADQNVIKFFAELSMINTKDGSGNVLATPKKLTDVTKQDVVDLKTRLATEFTSVKQACGTSSCHSIWFRAKDGDEVVSNPTYETNTPVYLGYATGNNNLSGDASIAGVMGAGHRHPTQIPAKRVLLSGKIIDGTYSLSSASTYETGAGFQARLKDGPVNVGVPLEGVNAGHDTAGQPDPVNYPKNDVVCLTCHMAHGSRTGIGTTDPTTGAWTDSFLVGDVKMESAYKNDALNGTANPDGTANNTIKNEVSGYYRTNTIPAQGVSTVLARMQPMASVCFRCHSVK